MSRLLLTLISISFLSRVIKGNTYESQFYKDTNLLIKPYKDASPIGILTGTAGNAVTLARDILEQFIIAVTNIKFPDNPIYSNLPQAQYNTSQLISKVLDFPVEEYLIPTRDGYLLGVQRIPSSRQGAPPVLFVHGIMESGKLWVINAKWNQNLPTILSKEGYDVWIANLRGAPDSRKHVKYTDKDPKFWEFSYNEYSQIDLPSMIDYILDKTGTEQISLIGHSLGCGLSMALLSRNPEYNSKVNVLVAFSPFAKTTHVRNPAFDLYQLFSLLTPLSGLIGTKGKFFPLLETYDDFNVEICKISIVNAFYCQITQSILISLKSRNINVTLIPVILDQYLATTSTYVLVHFAQIRRDDRFQMYDFGKYNFKVYGEDKPPAFDVRRVEAPVALFSSLSDELADPEDVKYLRENIPNQVIDFVFPLKDQFNHVDSFFGLNAPTMLYPRVVQILKSITGYD